MGSCPWFGWPAGCRVVECAPHVDFDHADCGDRIVIAACERLCAGPTVVSRAQFLIMVRHAD